MDVTHADCTNPPSGSSVAQELDEFKMTTLGTYVRPPVIFCSGKGLNLYAEVPVDNHGPGTMTRYLDFAGGIAVNSLGHADEGVADIAAEQASTLVHTSNLYHNNWSGRLLQRLAELTRQFGGVGLAPKTRLDPHSWHLRGFLANSGTEANEAALKFARKVGSSRSTSPASKTGYVCFQNGFHGRTMGALSVTPNPKYQAPFDPLIPNVRVGELNSFENLQSLVDESVAGVIVEPIQGEGGVFPADIDWLIALRQRCDQVGAVLIYDEIQCGLFRTGTMWCHSEMPIAAHPDMVTMAKPLANGFPIGAVLMRPEVAEVVAAGDHGTTFGGGPFTSRIAHYVLGRLSDPALTENVREMSRYLVERLERIQVLFEDMVDPNGLRGRGLLLGLQLKQPDLSSKILAMARHRGVLILTAGQNTLRFVPSLTLTKADVDEAMDVLESCFLVARKQQL
ncbi:acetylornithine transaminase [Malassezia vespertilionis]|nr:acetylornithine transaminase [Malassezia vespertilionis]WFD04691.1 acetylornithine transaminase [Malassezia vespertilionis]